MSSDDWLRERLVRNEALVSNGELRLEVAKAIERTVMGSETIMVREYATHIGGDWLEVRAESDRSVGGSLERKCDHSDLIMIKGGDIREVVNGGVHQHATVDGEAIVGGGYNGNQVGPFLRLTAFCDFLSWGMWLEADASRVEMAMLGLRAYMAYVHQVGLKSQLAAHFFDDWLQRTENIGVLVDNQGAATRMGGVGSGTETHV